MSAPATVVAEKRCQACRVTKPAAEYYRHAGSPDGLQYQCKPCQRERLRLRYRAHRIAAGLPVRGAGAPDLNDAIRRAVEKSALAGRHATRARTGDGQRVVVIPALLWAECVAARMRLAAAAGISGGGE